MIRIIALASGINPSASACFCGFEFNWLLLNDADVTAVIWVGSAAAASAVVVVVVTEAETVIGGEASALIIE